LSKLLGGVERAALQVELSALRILFELLRFLLSQAYLCWDAPSNLSIARVGRVSVYNG
jgi:hypothetical protein